MSKGNITWLIIILVIIVAVVLIFAFTGKSSTNKTNNKTSLSGDNQITHCGNDSNCFFSAMADCKKADANITLKLDSLDMPIETTTYYNIKGKENDRCILYRKNIKTRVVLSDEIKKMLLTQMSDTNIQNKLDESNKELAKMDGLDSTCKFKLSTMATLAKDWANGKLYNEDDSDANCTGSLYNMSATK